MNVLVTGATGLIGNALAKRLAAEGHRVRALVRDVERASKLLPPAVERVRGDVTDPASLEPACAGVEVLFHAAGMPEQWQRDEGIFDRVNRQGTANVLEAARRAGVRRAVYTSTMDVFAAPDGGTLTEERIDAHPKHSAYERSKQDAEREAEAVRQRGLDVVFVNPAAVYGPSPVHIALNSFFIRLLTKKMPMLPPGGMSVAYIDGVVEAHLLALSRGRSGERYLIADAHLSTRALAEHIVRAAGSGRVPAQAPAGLLKVTAAAMAPLARAFGFEPLVAPGQLGFMLWDAHVDASKAVRELGFRQTPVEEGIRRTVEFLRAEKLI